MPTYTVQPGDSWTRIAGNVYSDQRMFQELMAANPDISMLHPGMVINLPDQVANPYVSQAALTSQTNPFAYGGAPIPAPSAIGQPVPTPRIVPQQQFRGTGTGREGGLMASRTQGQAPVQRAQMRRRSTSTRTPAVRASTEADRWRALAAAYGRTSTSTTGREGGLMGNLTQPAPSNLAGRTIQPTRTSQFSPPPPPERTHIYDPVPTTPLQPPAPMRQRSTAPMGPPTPEGYDFAAEVRRQQLADRKPRRTGDLSDDWGGHMTPGDFAFATLYTGIAIFNDYASTGDRNSLPYRMTTRLASALPWRDTGARSVKEFLEGLGYVQTETGKWIRQDPTKRVAARGPAGAYSYRVTSGGSAPTRTYYGGGGGGGDWGGGYGGYSYSPRGYAASTPLVMWRIGL